MITTSWFQMIAAMLLALVLWDLIKAWWRFYCEFQAELTRIKDEHRRQLLDKDEKQQQRVEELENLIGEQRGTAR